MAESLLPQPDTPVQMKVFQGGGGSSGGGTESLLPQPEQSVPLIEFKGGGKMEEQKQKGGAENIKYFRGIKPDTLHDDFKQYAIVLQIVDPAQIDGTFPKESGIDVIPVVINESYEITYVPGTKNLNTLFVFSEKGGELTNEDVKDFYRDPFTKVLLFTSDALNSTKSVFVPKPKAEIQAMKIATKGQARNEPKDEDEKPQPPQDTNQEVVIKSSLEGKTIQLAEGYRVRYVTDTLKDDIINLRFTPMEEELFNEILQFNHEFLKKYIKEHPDEFYEFWKTYINNDGTSQLVLMTYKEGEIIQTFLSNVLDAYRHELTQTALKFLQTRDRTMTPELFGTDVSKDTLYYGSQELGSFGPTGAIGGTGAIGATGASQELFGPTGCPAGSVAYWSDEQHNGFTCQEGPCALEPYVYNEIMCPTGPTGLCPTGFAGSFCVMPELVTKTIGSETITVEKLYSDFVSTKLTEAFKKENISLLIDALAKYPTLKELVQRKVKKDGVSFLTSQKLNDQEISTLFTDIANFEIKNIFDLLSALIKTDYIQYTKGEKSQQSKIASEDKQQNKFQNFFIELLEKDDAKNKRLLSNFFEGIVNAPKKSGKSKKKKVSQLEDGNNNLESVSGSGSTEEGGEGQTEDNQSEGQTEDNQSEGQTEDNQSEGQTEGEGGEGQTEEEPKTLEEAKKQIKDLKSYFFEGTRSGRKISEFDTKVNGFTFEQAKQFLKDLKETKNLGQKSLPTYPTSGGFRRTRRNNTKSKNVSGHRFRRSRKARSKQT